MSPFSTKPLGFLLVLGFLVTAGGAPAGPLSGERFERFRMGDRSVDAIQLLPASADSPQLVAWVDGDEIRVGSPDDLGLSAAPSVEPSLLLPAALRGKLVLRWGTSDLQRGIYDLNRVATFVATERSGDLEVSLLVTRVEGGGFRGALAWRVRRGGKAASSGSTVFKVPEGEEARVALGATREGLTEARLTIAAR